MSEPKRNALIGWAVTIAVTAATLTFFETREDKSNQELIRLSHDRVSIELERLDMEVYRVGLQTKRIEVELDRHEIEMAKHEDLLNRIAEGWCEP